MRRERRKIERGGGREERGRRRGKKREERRGERREMTHTGSNFFNSGGRLSSLNLLTATELTKYSEYCLINSMEYCRVSNLKTGTLSNTPTHQHININTPTYPAQKLRTQSDSCSLKLICSQQLNKRKNKLPTNLYYLL